MKDITIPGGKNAEKARKLMRVFSPLTGAELEGEYPVTRLEEVQYAVEQATAAFPVFSTKSGQERAAFLTAIGEEIMALGDDLIQRAMMETGLPEPRLNGERARTIGQLNLFANHLREGSWVDAILDPADPDRKPFPKPDLRQMLQPLGPVAIFGAGNFPLAFSTAGGDTASALAAGCPVVLKAHEGHLGTNALVSRAIRLAAERTGMPDHVFQYVVGDGYITGLELVRHPGIKAAGFTGSFSGGKALLQATHQREDPIPFFAEMGSTNPIVVLPEAMCLRGDVIGQQLVWSFTLNAGQFCTNPGLILVREGDGLDTLIDAMHEAVLTRQSELMYGNGIRTNYDLRSRELLQLKGVTLIGKGADGGPLDGQATLAKVNAVDFLIQPELQHEVFGPFSLIVVCPDDHSLLHVLRSLGGQLTATLMAEESELHGREDLMAELIHRCGRLVWNGVPTGVEVSPAMHHGGPWPASSDARFTSVGTQAIRRWVRPVCYQNIPEIFLPLALQSNNPLHIWRRIGAEWTKEGSGMRDQG
ncbi:MAG: aldehyde dehydrogenase (NADP(+)) [Saprospiraceae bacterium]|nr:aldehyde dehydrogenase (NADP(+)) [Saprospiraceae bacterium]